MFPFGKSKKKLRKEISELKDQVHELYKLQFREGDMVYINDGHRDPRIPFYLCKSYNNGNCYYVSTEKGKHSHYIGDEAHTKYMSHEPPKQCHCCNHLLIKEVENDREK